MCAMGPKARSSLRSSSVVWSRARTSDRKVTQKCWSSFVSENVTPSESSKPITTCPMPLLILPQRSSPARPKPSIASKNVFSVPRAKRVWPTMSSLSASAPNEVRNWKGWHHHQILSLIATWFLVTEARRGKKMDTGDYRAADPRRHQFPPALCLPMRYSLPHPARTRAVAHSQRTRPPLPLETA